MFTVQLWSRELLVEKIRAVARRWFLLCVSSVGSPRQGTVRGGWVDRFMSSSHRLYHPVKLAISPILLLLMLGCKWHSGSGPQLTFLNYALPLAAPLLQLLGVLLLYIGALLCRWLDMFRLLRDRCDGMGVLDYLNQQYEVLAQLLSIFHSPGKPE